jgi:hypothetical protein
MGEADINADIARMMEKLFWKEIEDLKCEQMVLEDAAHELISLCNNRALVGYEWYGELQTLIGRINDQALKLEQTRFNKEMEGRRNGYQDV